MNTPVTAIDDILASIRSVIEERDQLRAQVEKQGRIMAKLQELINELEPLLAGDTELETTETPAQPEPMVSPVSTLPAIDDELLAGWGAEYDAGTTCTEIAARYGISKFVVSGHLSQWRRRQASARICRAESALEGTAEANDQDGDDAMRNAPGDSGSEPMSLRGRDLYPIDIETHCLRCGTELTLQNRQGSFCRECKETIQSRREAVPS